MNTRRFFTFVVSAAMLIGVGGGFTGCKDPDNEKEAFPELTTAPTSLSFDAEEATQTLKVTANCKWEIVAVPDFCTVEPMSGNGNADVTVSVPASEEQRSGNIKFQLYYQGSKWSDYSVKVSQNAGDLPTPVTDFIYKETCGTTVSKVDGYWPYVDKYEGWDPQGGDGVEQGEVTYSGSGASVRNSGKAWAPDSDAEFASDAPYAYISKDGNYFQINKINLKSGVKNYTFNFTAFDTYASLEASPYTPAAVPVTDQVVTLSVSTDGEAWGKVAFTAVADGANGWYIATAPFTLPEDAAQLYIKWSDFKADTATAVPDGYKAQASLRLDDFVLAVGGDGPVVDFTTVDPNPQPGETTPIKDITAAGVYTAEGYCAAVSAKSFILQDATGYILVYTNGTVFPAVGADLKVTGGVSKYGGMFQFSTSDKTQAAEIEEKGTTSTVTYPAAETLDGAAIEAYIASPSAKFITYTGKLVKDGNFYNIIVEGTEKVGGVSYPNADLIDKLDGMVDKNVVVTGYAIGYTNQSKTMSTMVTDIVASDVPAEPSIRVDATSLAFAAEGETKTFNVTVVNEGDMGIITVSSSDRNAFTASESNGVVTVTAAANTTGAARTATLTVKYENAYEGTVYDTKTVELSQAAPATGNEKTIVLSLDTVNPTPEFKSNEYGSQNVADISTYAEWTIDGITFIGARLCISTITPGTIQGQGNASTASKQSRFGNTASMGNIKKIEVVTVNESNTPNFNLAVGASQVVGTAVPSNMVGAASMTQTVDGTTYTNTYDVPAGNGYFAIYKNTTGALYIKSVTVYYE